MTPSKGSGIPAKGPGRGGPARGYRWPPFQEGHELTLRHGAYSPRKVDPLATELVGIVLEDVSYLAEPSYQPALWAWARAEARVQLLSEYIDEHGPLDDQGNPRSALEALRRFEQLASDHRSRLGLDPLSRSRLGRDAASRAVDLATIELSEARRLRLEAEARIAEESQLGTRTL